MEMQKIVKPTLRAYPETGRQMFIMLLDFNTLGFYTLASYLNAHPKTDTALSQNKFVNTPV